MKQSQLDREVAHLTGESVGFIRSMGFSPLIIPSPPKPRKYARQAAFRAPKVRHFGSMGQALQKAA